MKPRRLTKKQQHFYNHLEKYISSLGYSPTLQELKDALNFTSINSVNQFLKALERHGFISRKPNQQRGIFLTNIDDNNILSIATIPVISSAGCDNLEVFADRCHDEYISVDKSFLEKSREEVVAFRAVGSSMVDAGIENGDYVLTEITENIGSGDLVVANVEGKAVVKRIQFTPNAVILNPESKFGGYIPIIMKDNSKIIGKAIDIIRMSSKEDRITYVPLEEN
ncbi:MAG: transcriptional repressor LexA [Candidatus Taylorbacteria bacterium]|nr:transcriptional repressor LexA [Candidatus Taylorbacteria bacterium]